MTPRLVLVFSAIATAALAPIPMPAFGQATPPVKPSAATKPAATQSAPVKAAAKLEPAVGGSADKLAVTLSLSDGSRIVTRTRKDLGFSLASKPGEPVVFSVDLAVLKESLTRIAPQFHQDAIEPHPALISGAVKIDAGSYARALNVATTAANIVEAVHKDAATTKFAAVLEKHAPKTTAERYKGIDGVLASFSTRTNANPKRNHNVALAAGTIDGTLLAPNATFSVNQTVGQRTQARGFQTAPVFVNAEMVPGIGGGVSQITGTLFNAVARTSMTVVEVYPHSRPVAYLPIGYDATVAFGEEDLKFKNNTGAPVYIDYAFDIKKRRLTATLFGKKTPGQVIRLQAKIDRLAPGQVDAELYRIIKQNGKVVAKQRLFKHKYRWDPSTKA